MQHKVKVTVIDKKCFTDYQEKYLADKQSGPCPFYQVGDEFVFERYNGTDDFWREGNGSQCAEAWDCISRYIYTGLQGGSIMRGWTNDERMMIACCNDGTRPVIFKIERIDYQVVRMEGLSADNRIKAAFESMAGVKAVTVQIERNFVEIYLDNHTAEKTAEEFQQAIKGLHDCQILKVE